MQWPGREDCVKRRNEAETQEREASRVFFNDENESDKLQHISKIGYRVCDYSANADKKSVPGEGMSGSTMTATFPRENYITIPRKAMMLESEITKMPG